MSFGHCSASTTSSGMSATYGINHTRSRHNLFEVEGLVSDVPQGSSLLATLGFVAESLWDSCSHAGFKIFVRRRDDGRTPAGTRAVDIQNNNGAQLAKKRFVNQVLSAVSSEQYQAFVAKSMIGQRRILIPSKRDMAWPFLLVSFLVESLFANLCRAQTLGEALDATNLTWTTTGTGGAAGWSVETTHTHDGISAAKSSTLYLPSQTSILQTTVTGPGTLSFWWSEASVTTFPSLVKAISRNIPAAIATVLLRLGGIFAELS